MNRQEDTQIAATAAISKDPATGQISPEERLRELRAMALSALVFGPQGLDLWRCYGELKHMSVPKGMQIEMLEAQIGICVAARIRPSMTTRAIRKLRNLRTERGEAAQFDAFEALFKRSLGASRLSNHGYRTENFADLDHLPVWERVGAHIAALSDRGYPVFLNSGTLLGVIRDKRLIDHDDDIDLAVILNATSDTEAAAEWTSLTADLRAAGLVDTANFNDPAILKLLPIGEIQVDLFPGWISADDKVHVYPHTYLELRRGDVLPLGTCPVSGNPIPAQPEKMLAVNYGPGWQDPDPYFKFPWSKARKTFARFLEALT